MNEQKNGHNERRSMRAWAAAVAVGFWRAVVLAAVSWLVPAIWAAAVIVCILWRGNEWSWIAPIVLAGVFTFVLAKPIASFFRLVVGRYTATEIVSPYREPAPIIQVPTGFWWNGHSYSRTSDEAEHDAQTRLTFTDPARWRDVRWLAIAPVLVGLACAVPPVAVVIAAFAFSRPSPVAVVAGVLLVVAAAVASPFAWRSAPAAVSRWLNSAPAHSAGEVELTAELTARVRELTAQRAELTVVQSAEIRRIERDLHDGAQARLVALGLTLATAERVMGTDPDEAMRLLREARVGASTSLTELRELVRGVNPPVLTDRGLVDALRALALDTALPVDVESRLSGRVDAPVESALYFATTEVLSNALKHAEATRVQIRLSGTETGIELEVEDDGRGGASVKREGGGLSGVRRRLAAFDGTLSIVSAPGGPTRVTMRVPCVLS